ncbi:hypothetical protein [Lentibacillus amyloliquefaciens]|uniref:Uncharacterized protein n=1 Tax=Lentibacillus amyloliquefaciens TaxID=1472767 RepID=A0A0U4FXH2_9BACI|nr:hypothetical protein [Lentibacillus amyloliquefaciens]ALX50453.1 hypothetical protein AOX59_18825 [Lentibacillus amyloliquefaciens]
MTKQELIDFYQKEYQEHFIMAENHLQDMIDSADEVEADYSEKHWTYHRTIASMCEQFVKYLKELE